MNSREIVLVSNFFGDGGAARVLSVLAEGFFADGYRVTLCSYSKEDVAEYKLKDGIEHIKFVLKRKKGFLRKLERISVLRKELKKHPGATVISFEYFVNMQTIIACFGLKNRLIVSERNDPAKMGGKFPTSFLRNILYRFSDVLVCQTPDAKAYFPKGIQKKAVVIANPIKENLPEPYTGERDKRIVNFCRLEKQKNLTLLIDSFEMFSNTHADYTLHIYGDGKERGALEEYVRSKNLKGKVLLHNSTPNIHEEVKTAAMFVSSSNYEGMSNSMLEAMAIGLPTICTDCPCGGARMIIQDRENGLLVPVGDARMLTDAVCEIADNGALSQQLSENAVKIKKNLSVQKILCEWKNIIK